MRKTSINKTSTLLITLAMICLPAAAQAVLITTNFDLPDSQVISGDNVTVDLQATIDATSPIVSFGLDINFDPLILETVSVVVPTPVPFVGSVINLSTDGLIEMFGFASVPVSGMVNLASLTFLGQESGSTSLTATINPLEPTEGFGTLLPPFKVSLGVISLGEGTVAVVPEPSTWLMMSTSLLGIAFYGWRKRQQGS